MGFALKTDLDRIETTRFQGFSKTFTPELLKRPYREGWSPQNPTWGFCYIASEACWHMLGGFESPWRPVWARDQEGGTHWWLEHILTKERLDPTADQYLLLGETPPYSQGVRAGFLTKTPSKRAQILIDRYHALEIA